MSDSNRNDSGAQRPRIAVADALRNHWFEIWYQAKVDLKRKCLAGAEALARIRHPELGILLPGSFVAEVDENSIAQLAELTLLAALSDWTMFDEAGFNLHLAVNVPVSVLVKLAVSRLVGEHRPKSAQWPGLIIELTEDQIVRDMARAKQVAGQLRVSDVRIAIDHFGAGYSAFARLRDLPIAELKIASDFVSGCSTDATNGAICQTAIDLAHRVGSMAVADGVEHAMDLQAMMAMGCDFAQGPLIAPLLPRQEFLDLLLQHNAPRPRAPSDLIDAGARPVGRVA
jgi:EAL domain-containing protein (putative c-di-GMP-specific phosphodiesterase class I)